MIIEDREWPYTKGHPMPWSRSCGGLHREPDRQGVQLNVETEATNCVLADSAPGYQRSATAGCR
jgi:hypothetical protein